MSNMKPFIFGDWHAWQGDAAIMLSDEGTKTLREFDSAGSAVNWLFTNGHKEAARALHKHVSGGANQSRLNWQVIEDNLTEEQAKAAAKRRQSDPVWAGYEFRVRPSQFHVNGSYQVESLKLSITTPQQDLRARQLFYARQSRYQRTGRER